MSSSLYISDLHLQASEPALTELAFELFKNAECDQLYILGDLFEYWIGDDSVDKTAAEVSQKLKALNDRGTEIIFMHGNRDFLVGEDYVASFNGKLVREDSITLTIAGTKTLIMHGDTLCTDDTQYQFYRRMVRNTDWQKDFLAKSISEREATARMIRNTSKVRGGRAHDEKIADINEDRFIQAVVDNKVSRVIHGHTHRPFRHVHTHNNTEHERLVLGDWKKDHAIIAVSDDKNCELLKWDGSVFSALD